MLSILFGLAAALSWGSSDFTGGLLSRRSGALQTTLSVEIIGLPPLIIITLISPQPAMPLNDWLWCIAAGSIRSLGFVALYKALAEGQMSVTAPVAALISVLLPVLTGIWTEGMPNPLALFGFVLALIAIWLVSQSGAHPQITERKPQSLTLPILAGAGLGGYLIFINQGSHSGVWLPILAARLAATVTLFLFAVARKELIPPARSNIALLFLNAAFDIGGSAFYVLAGQQGRMDVSAVLSSLYSGVTLLLAGLFLQEKIIKQQRIGIMLTLTAIILLTLHI